MSQEPRDLNVWLGGRVVADLAVNRRQVAQLRYSDDYVAERGDGALGLSVPLPVSSRQYRGDIVDRWIESLLPEGETRTILEQFFRVRRGDGFALLAALGRDCAGAVAILPPGEDLAGDVSTLQPLTPAEVEQAVAALRQHPLGVDQDVRVSLGGLQSKLLLVQVDGGWARPLGGTPSTHILKPDPPEFPGLVASEAFAQRVAALAGLDAAEVRLEAFGDRLVLVVTRFDREFKGGRLVRRHQEDGCQALGTIPSGPAKYQASDGVVSYQRLAAVLARPRERSDRSTSSARRNGHVHCRNRQYRRAPAKPFLHTRYRDTQLGPGFRCGPHLSIRGHARLGPVGRRPSHARNGHPQPHQPRTGQLGNGNRRGSRSHRLDSSAHCGCLEQGIPGNS
jgi:HipA-like protein